MADQAPNLRSQELDELLPIGRVLKVDPVVVVRDGHQDHVLDVLLLILQLVVPDKYPLDGVADVELDHKDDTMNLCIHILDPGPGHQADVAELNILAVLVSPHQAISPWTENQGSRL